MQAAQGLPGFRFDKQAEAVQGQGKVQAGREQLMQGGLHLCRERFVKNVCSQGEMKAVLLEHVRVAPEGQIFPFVAAQPGGAAAGHLTGAQGGAEPVEMAHAQRGKHMHRLAVADRPQAEKIIQAGDGQGRQADGPLAAGEIDQGIDQFGLGAARLEAKRTGQGGLKPVMARHPGQFVEQGWVEVRETGPDNGPVGQAIPAEPLAPCLPESGDRGRGMGDGITHETVHGGVAGRRLALYAGPTRVSALCPAGFRAGL